MSRIAVSLAVGSRWISVASLFLGAAAASALEPVSSVPGLLVQAVIGLTLIQAYLGMRLEVDKRIFESLGENVQERLKTFDRCMVSLRLVSPRKTGRSMNDRVRGVLSLVKWAAFFMVLQFAVFIVALCIR